MKEQFIPCNISAPSSKSYVQRALICSFLCSSESKIFCNNFCDDVKVVSDCIKNMGASVKTTDCGFSIIGADSSPSKASLNFGDSGAAFRFLLPVICAKGIESSYQCGDQLSLRPHQILIDELTKHGATISNNCIKGKITSGKYCLPGNVSSQYISGLLLALPLLDGDSEIELSSPLESSSYVDMTIDVLHQFGVNIDVENGKYLIKGNQHFFGTDIVCEGDWSLSSFFFCAGYLLSGLNCNSLQGDKAILNLINNSEIDASQIPDLVPTLASYALTKPGKTRIYNAHRLIYKETNRLESLQKSLSSIGGDIQIHNDELIICGKESLCGGIADSYGDHRIAMALALASIKCKNDVTILNSDCVSKSYPEFFQKWRDIGCHSHLVTQ